MKLKFFTGVILFLCFLLLVGCKKKNERFIDGEWTLVSYRKNSNSHLAGGWNSTWQYDFNGSTMTEIFDGTYLGPPFVVDTHFVNTYPYSMDLLIDKAGAYSQIVGGVTEKSGTYSWKDNERTRISFAGWSEFNVSGLTREELTLSGSTSSSSMGNSSTSSFSYVFQRK